MIGVRIGELAEAGSAALLRPVTAAGEAATAASRRLESIAGERALAQLEAAGELPVGAAVITPAGGADAEFLVHAVVRSHEEPVTLDTVRRALENAFRRLDEWGLESVALPLLGTGPGNLDPELVVSELVPMLRGLVRTRPRQVMIVAESEYELSLIERELALPATPDQPL